MPRLGTLNPTAARVQMGVVTVLDLAAFDAISWNINFDVLGNPGNEFTTAQAFNLVAVPDPATWGLMMVGFGMVGASLRRRKRGGTHAATA